MYSIRDLWQSSIALPPRRDPFRALCACFFFSTPASYSSTSFLCRWSSRKYLCPTSSSSLRSIRRRESRTQRRLSVSWASFPPCSHCLARPLFHNTHRANSKHSVGTHSIHLTCLPPFSCFYHLSRPSESLSSLPLVDFLHQKPGTEGNFALMATGASSLGLPTQVGSSSQKKLHPAEKPGARFSTRNLHAKAATVKLGWVQPRTTSSAALPVKPPAAPAATTTVSAAHVAVEVK